MRVAGISAGEDTFWDKTMPDGSAADWDMRAALVAALPRLRRFCHGMTGSAHDGDDLMQATVERALQRSGQFEPGTRFDSWIFRIAQNLHIDAARMRKRRGPHVPPEAAFAVVGDDGRRTVEERSELAAAQAALETLPQDQRAAFLLVVVEGLTYREAAEALDVPVGTIMSRIARARGRIELAVHHGTGSGQ